ncbi:MAG: hypothetical protein EP330_10010 [Deltaproteobacteria bacterium]|nr:MAG: hypothetical protein EP330_10010 [Deltaproteobacteria bacterium]
MLFLLTTLALAEAPDEVPVIDVSAYADEIVVLDDGEGHLVAFRKSAPREMVWYGDADHLYALQGFSSSASGDDTWSVTARDFRASNRMAGVELRDGRYSMHCAGNTRELSPLAASAAQKVVRKATFHEHRWRRNAVGAWRDEWGVYYFVDRATGDDMDLDHHVYIGWKGQILRAPLKLIASDSLGRVYSAGNGARRLVITGDKARYVQGEDRRELFALDLVYDGPFLYTDLGVYGAEPHGTPCDVLPLHAP